jgi:uncharacterized membrane-anchored protein
LSINFLSGVSHNIPAVYGVLAARIRALRSIASIGSATWADKMRRRFAVGMSEAIDLDERKTSAEDM